MKISGNLIYPRFYSVPVFIGMFIFNHPVEEVLGQVLTDVFFQTHLKKKVIKLQMVSFKQDRHLREISILHILHDGFVRNILHFLIF